MTGVRTLSNRAYYTIQTTAISNKKAINNRTTTFHKKSWVKASIVSGKKQQSMETSALAIHQVTNKNMPPAEDTVLLNPGYSIENLLELISKQEEKKCPHHKSTFSCASNVRVTMLGN